MILADLSGTLAAKVLAQGSTRVRFQIGPAKVCGFFALSIGLFLLSISWDRIECFPFSAINISKLGFSLVPSEKCVRIWPMLLPFLSGYLGCYEQVSMNWGNVRELGRKQVRLVSLFYTTIFLFIPAVVSMFVFEVEGDSISLWSLSWPLANTVIFGVLLSENFTDDKFVAFKDSQREFVVTFTCTLLLELFYFPELSLWGLLLCGLLIWFGIRELDSVFSNYPELGFETSDTITTLITKPMRHILSERKSRKIALFLMINTGYMFVEFTVGFMSNSLGLISDACHMLFDCAALAIGLYASYISRLPANGQFNYGRGRFEVLSGYVNAVFLVLVGALIVVESFERILDPQEISTSSLMTVSIGGLLVNVIGLIFFHEEHHHAHGGACSHSHEHHHDHKVHDDHQSHSHNQHDHKAHDDHEHHHSHDDVAHNHAHGGACSHSHEHHHDHKAHDDHKRCHSHDDVAHNEHDHKSHSDHHNGHKVEKKKHKHIDHNMEGIFLHVLADTLGSVGVVISTLLIKYKGWLIADPACSIFISVLIVSSVIPLLRNSAEILLQRVPRAHEHDLREAVNDIMKIQGLRGIQNLHVWSFTNTDIVGTVHLRVSTDTDKASAKDEVSRLLQDAGIKDLTLQVECVESNRGARI